MVQYSQINKCNTSHKQKERKNRIIILIDARKAFDEVQYPFMIKKTKTKTNLSNMGIEGAFLSITKAVYERSTANIILNGQKLKAFPLRSGTKQGYQLLPLLFNVVLEVLARASDKKKTKKASELERRKQNCHCLQMA